jgi:hypothetical protein
VTGNDEHHPDESTEPPDQPEGKRVQGGELRLETRVSRDHTDVMVESGSDMDAGTESGEVTDVPGNAQEEPEDPREGATGRNDEEEAASPDSKPQHCRDTTNVSDGNMGVGEARRQVQGSGCDSGQGSGNSTMNDASGKSQRIALKVLAEDGQCQHRERLANESKDSPELPEPPDDATQRRTQSPSVELEGERRVAASCDAEPARAETDTSGVPGCGGDDRKRPTKLRATSERVSTGLKENTPKYLPGRTKVEPRDPGCEADTSAASGRVEDNWKEPMKLADTSELERERSKRRCRRNSPGRPGEEPDEPDDEAVVPGDLQNDRERPRSISNERVDETNAPHRRNSPGGHLGEPEASRGVKGVQDRGTVVDSAEYNWTRPKSDGNARGVVPNPPCRVRGPGGRIGEPKASRDVEGDWSRESDGEGVGYDGRRGGKHSATSSASHDSKRVGTRLLAGDKPGHTESASARERTYLGHPHHLPVIPGRSPIISTHCVDEDDSRRILEGSAARK